YDPSFEHDNCGIGAVVNIKGKKTYKTVDDALTIVERLKHRAGMDAKQETGDGVGILLQIPHAFFRKHVALNLPKEDFGVGMFFLPNEELKAKKAKQMFEVIANKEGLEVLGWRKVDVDESVLGTKALACMPMITQCFIAKPANVKAGIDFDRKLYIVRKIFESSHPETYVCSLSSRTIVYKGMFLVGQLRSFYKDLQNHEFVSAIALVHSRFSTNTMPSWERAHPNRLIVHNGEINTIRGNANKMLAREENMQSTILKDELKKVLPVIDTRGSDSARLDNTLEFMMMAGIELPRAMMMCIPEPYQNDRNIAREKRDFYQYNACLMEPWDGPASILFSDGDVMGAVLDRNGLRPSRYYITNDDYLVLSSEVGVLPFDVENIKVKERLRPGKMLLVDTLKQCVIDDDTLKMHYACKEPYGEWLESNLVHLKEVAIPNQKCEQYEGKHLEILQKVHGYSYEDAKNYILPLALNGIEPVIAMGIDSPLAILSKMNQPLFNYFKQLFAQVTNPPIDAIREEIITSSEVYLGKEGNLLTETSANAHLLKIENPILSNMDMLKIKTMNKEGFKVKVLSIIYYKNSSLENALDNLFIEADKAIHENATILVLSDRGVDENHVPIPSLLAISAMQQYLVKSKKRMSVALILESAEPREVHHFATLLGYGASAINPYLAHDTIADLIKQNLLNKDYYAAVDDYDHGILHGIIKIASKMGISTIQSYQGSQIFEAIGISKKVIDKYFTNTISRVEGIDLEDIQEGVEARHNKVYDTLGLPVDQSLDSNGFHQLRSHKEEHLYNPKTIHMLQKATRETRYDYFKEYTKMIDEEMQHTTLRGQLEFVFPKKGISIDEVESVESIVTRFKTGAMSYGSISKEAHECMAIAMNRLKGKSNSGEGGEDKERFLVDENGDSKCSAIKQVASGRFGVTSEYLISAKEIQIKMAQGAKPGEGGQLPASKVYPWIAKTRHSTPAVSLISPPPHHDIYSIEDLAQLIYDLKCANEKARISVKLVSEAGVGTIAAGVAKAGAEVILISGYDGGTGAAPKNSVYHAGLPWELGLVETHQTLMMNGLRNRVVIESDGKLMSGKDVAIACLLGAEEFGFATAPLVSMGCVMMRVCNLDTCPVGIATQNPILRKRFSGKPEYVENFMRFIAQELREYMAKLGCRTIDEMVGKTHLLKVREQGEQTLANKLSFTSLLQPFDAQKKEPCTFQKQARYDFELEKTKDEQLLQMFMPYLKQQKAYQTSLQVDNLDRTLGTRLGSMITRLCGSNLNDDMYQVHCYGSGGQSFGAFIPKGLTLTLEGDSNDYFAKGLSGGKLAIYPDKKATFKADENIIIGNVACYGATSGEVYIAGIAGERFAIRNSGATCVVEGVGDHGLEYMTGGKVLILGACGRNIAAGMSGGVAYILDEDNNLYAKLNKELVEMSIIEDSYDIEEIKKMIERHVQHTNSQKGAYVLAHFDEYIHKFKKIIPYDYKKIIALIKQNEKRGMSDEQAKMEAFYAVKEG
ncbi:MAG: glutamate synthase large subunit, partial [Erysipelotrichia bacterium]|nr:glutamate synthase large subunit [Erysipelotrichia bacterium]